MTCIPTCKPKEDNITYHNHDDTIYFKIVPLHILMDDEEFSSYMAESNDKYVNIYLMDSDFFIINTH